LGMPSNFLDEMFLRIGNITISITSENPEIKLGVEGAVKKFVISEASPDVRIRTAWRNLSEETYGEKIFDSATFWQLYDLNGSYLFRFFFPGRGPLTYKVAFFNPNFSFGEVHLHRLFFKPETPFSPLDSSLDQLLVTNWLAKGRGALVHACGVTDLLGNGHLFCGQSGAGKTTIAKLWEEEPGVTVLSDDRIILRKFEDKIWMYGTPWHGEAMFASPTRAPLKTISFLEKGQKHELISQKQAGSVSRLFTCTFPPFYNRDALDFTLSFLEDVVKKVPCYELRFKPDKNIVNFIRRLNYSEYYSSILNLHH
jgi:hypothetical protein